MRPNVAAAGSERTPFFQLFAGPIRSPRHSGFIAARLGSPFHTTN
jgi:hypothetical protein